LSGTITVESEHAVTDRNIGDAHTNFVDKPSGFVAQSLWEILVHQALTFLPVTCINTGRMYRNTYIA